MFHLKIKKEFRFQTKHGEVVADVQEVDGNRVIVLKKQYVHPNALSNGMSFIRNRRQKNSASNGTEYAGHASLYSAERSQVIQLGRSGFREDVLDGERQLVLADQRAILAYQHTLFDPELLGEDEAAWRRLVIEEVIRILTTKRNGFKRVAKHDLERALMKIDTLGRRNPGAAALSAGAALGRLREREVEIRAIAGYVNTRSIRIRHLIEDVIERYKWLMELLGGYKDKLGLLADFAARPTPGTMAVTAEKLDRQRRLFAHVCAAPFLSNAAHLRKDLKRAHIIASNLAGDGNLADINELREIYARMRKGIACVGTLHHLETKIRTPLALLVEEAMRSARTLKQITHAPPHEEIEVGRIYAPEGFDLVAERLRTLKKRMTVAGSDTALAHPVRDEALDHINLALNCVDEDDWRTVRKHLRNASNVLGGVAERVTC